MDNYMMLEKIGNGSFGNVYQVYQKETEQLFACKKFK